MIRFLFAHRQFVKKAIAVLSCKDGSCESVKEFCSDLDPIFTSKFLLPFISAVWSVGYGDANEFAIRPFLRFMHNHRFLGLQPMQWYTPQGRSQSYVTKLIKACGNKLEIKLDTTATKINVRNHILETTTQDRRTGTKKAGKVKFDKLILASSAPIQAKLKPPAKHWLSNFKTNASRVCGHLGTYIHEDMFVCK